MNFFSKEKKKKKKEGRRLLFVEVLLCVGPWASLDIFRAVTVILEEGSIIPILKMKEPRLKACPTLES